MANNTRLNQATTVGDNIATLEVGGVKHEQVIVEYLVGGAPQMVDATHQLPVTSTPATAPTGTTTSVNDQATNITLLAANASRKGATIYNDSTEILYLKLGVTASLTSFTVKMVAQAYYEVPFGYTGNIDGIWANDAAGAARITELT